VFELSYFVSHHRFLCYVLINYDKNKVTSFVSFRVGFPLRCDQPKPRLFCLDDEAVAVGPALIVVTFLFLFRQRESRPHWRRRRKDQAVDDGAEERRVEAV